MRFMENNRALNAEQFADAFLGDIANWSAQLAGQSQQDDITLLLFDFKHS
jgi:ABC-type phosphate transport system substrate-binding protein